MNQYFHNKQSYVSPATGNETDEMARRQGSLDQVEDQMYVEIITGKKPLDAFDEWVEEWTNLGGAVIEYEINEWYQSVQ